MTAVCEYCHREAVNPVDDGWDLIWLCWLCPECQARAEREHGTGYLPFVRGGEYADGRPDPRARKEQRA